MFSLGFQNRFLSLNKHNSATIFLCVRVIKAEANCIIKKYSSLLYAIALLDRECYSPTEIQWSHSHNSLVAL